MKNQFILFISIVKGIWDYPPKALMEELIVGIDYPSSTIFIIKCLYKKVFLHFSTNTSGEQTSGGENCTHPDQDPNYISLKERKSKINSEIATLDPNTQEDEINMKKDDLGEILNQMNNIINAYKDCMSTKFQSASRSSSNINIIACERYKCSTPSDGGSIFSNEQFKLTRAPACSPNIGGETICDSETGFLDDVYLLESAYNTSGVQNTLGSSIFLGIDAQTEGGKINYVVKAMDNPDDKDSWIKNKFYVLVDNNGKFLFYNIHWNVFLAYDGNKIIGAPKERMRELNPQGNSLLPSADGFKFELLKYTNLYISDMADKEEGTRNKLIQKELQQQLKLEQK